MSIHHLDCMRFWFGDPKQVFCSTRPDPRMQFPHTDGICTTILDYENGLQRVVIDDVWTGPACERCPGDIRIEWRMEGLDGLAIGNVGWCKDPYTTPSTMRYARKGDTGFTRFERHKLPIVSLPIVAKGLIDFNEPVRAFHVSRCERFVDLAAEFGEKNVLLVLGEYLWQREVIPAEHQWQWALETGRMLGDHAGRKGWTLR